MDIVENAGEVTEEVVHAPAELAFVFTPANALKVGTAKRRGRGIDPSYAPLYARIEKVLGGSSNAADVTREAAAAITAKNARGGKVVDANTVVRSLGAKYAKRGWAFRAVDCGSHAGVADPCDSSLLARTEYNGREVKGSHVLAYRTPDRVIRTSKKK